MSKSQQDPSRRGFLQKLAGYGAVFGFAAPWFSRTGLGRQDQAKAPLATVKIAEHPALEKDGGFVLVKGTIAGDVLVVRSGEGRFEALSNVCPHKQCLVEVKSASLIKCPCHSSAYKIDGTYVSGPSKKDLKKFRATLENGVITVTEN
jgi:nitrite reductase/ring-hydroxylating ferredoxin subunit